jgi:hypothetical protein
MRCPPRARAAFSHGLRLRHTAAYRFAGLIGTYATTSRRSSLAGASSMNERNWIDGSQSRRLDPANRQAHG